MDKLEECTYCLAKGRSKNLTPLYERDKPGFIRLYCPSCLSDVKKSAEEFNDRATDNGHLPLFRFGRKGEHLLPEVKKEF